MVAVSNDVMTCIDIRAMPANKLENFKRKFKTYQVNFGVSLLVGAQYERFRAAPDRSEIGISIETHRVDVDL